MLYVFLALFSALAAFLAALLGRIDIATLFLLTGILLGIWRVVDVLLDLLTQYKYKDYPPELRPKSRK